MTVATPEARVKPKRNRFEPTMEERNACERLSGFGLPIAEIARLIRGGISTATLQKCFHTELQTGKAKAHARVGQTLFAMAVSGSNPSATYFYCKTQMGRRETNHVEVTGSGDTPLIPAMPSVLIVPTLSLDTWEAEAAKQQQALMGGAARAVIEKAKKEPAPSSPTGEPSANPLIKRVDDALLYYDENL